MSFDSRGVLRGSCTLCHCSKYNSGTEMKRCLDCGHPPGKHKNMNEGHISTSWAAGSPSSLYGSQTNSTGGGGFHSSPTTVNSYGAAAAYQQPHRSPSPHHHHHHHQHLTQPQVPRCHAPGCINPAHCDFSLPESLRTFNYCSPQCRDIDLLPREKKTLAIGLEDLKRALQASATDDMKSSGTQIRRQPSYERSSSDSGLSAKFNSSPGVGKKKAEQTTVQVEGQKEPRQPFGLLLSKKVHSSDKTLGFVVVGAVRSSRGYFLLKDDSIRIFDVIEMVNDKSSSNLLIPYKEPQECFDKHLEHKSSVKMRINRSISLPSVFTSLNYARHQQLEFTHVIALRYLPGSSDDQCYGLSLSQPIGSSSRSNSKVMVEWVSKDSSAFNSGIKFGDRISVYTFASPDLVEDNNLVQLKAIAAILSEIKKAHTLKKSVIFVIHR